MLSTVTQERLTLSAKAEEESLAVFSKLQRDLQMAKDHIFHFGSHMMKIRHKKGIECEKIKVATIGNMLCTCRAH